MYPPQGYQSSHIGKIAQALKLKSNREGYHGGCPSCGYPCGFTINQKSGKLLFYCHVGRCSFRTITETLMRLGLWGAKEIVCTHPEGAYKQGRGTSNTSANPLKEQDTLRFIQKLWDASQPAAGTPVETYLKRRGITLQSPEAIRFVPHSLHRPSNTYHPMMIAAVTHHASSEVIGLHRTFLKPDGNGKADVEPNKMMLGKTQGGSVHLGKPEGVLAITEGLETGLSVFQATGIPTWAALSTAGMIGLDLPQNIQDVIICADNDVPGMKAAEKAAQKWLTEGRKVRIALPPRADMDFNDVLKETQPA